MAVRMRESEVRSQAECREGSSEDPAGRALDVQRPLEEWPSGARQDELQLVFSSWDSQLIADL